MNDLSQKSDGELVKLSLNNSDNYYFLLKRYEERLFKYVLRIAGLRTETVEDILQEVFIKVYKNLNDYDNKFTFSGWIYRITHNETINYIRKMKSRSQTIGLFTDENRDLLDVLADEINLPEELKQKELAEKMGKIIGSLPEKYRDVLVLRYLEDKDYKDMSDILEKSVGTVSTLLNRAKQYLKEALIKNNLDQIYE